MSIVTITSDLGNDSFSLAALKGVLFQNTAQATQIIDISNSIRSFDIVEAAFVFSNAYRFFPENTIHILSINPFYSQNYQLVLLKENGQYFIAPNHGILPLIFDQQMSGEMVQLNGFQDTSEYYNVLANTIQAIKQGEPMVNIGIPNPELFLKISLQPVVSKNIIRGTVIHVDRFGNLISNIGKKTFDKVRNNRDFAVYFRHKDPLIKICSHYHDVAVGDEVCLFNMSEHLEIAINMGNASEALGLYLDDTIQIDFFEQKPIHDH